MRVTCCFRLCQPRRASGAATALLAASTFGYRLERHQRDSAAGAGARPSGPRPLRHDNQFGEATTAGSLGQSPASVVG